MGRDILVGFYVSFFGINKMLYKKDNFFVEWMEVGVSWSGVEENYDGDFMF